MIFTRISITMGFFLVSFNLIAADSCESVVRRYLKLNDIDLSTVVEQGETIKREKFDAIRAKTAKYGKEKEKQINKTRRNTFLSKYKNKGDIQPLNRDELELLYLSIQKYFDVAQNLTLLTIKDVTTKQIKNDIDQFIESTTKEIEPLVHFYPFSKELQPTYYIFTIESMAKITFYQDAITGRLTILHRNLQNSIVKIDIHEINNQRVSNSNEVFTFKSSDRCSLWSPHSFSTKFFNDLWLDLINMTKEKCQAIISSTTAKDSSDLKRAIFLDIDFKYDHNVNAYFSFKEAWVAPYIQFCREIGEDLISKKDIEKAKASLK